MKLPLLFLLCLAAPTLAGTGQSLEVANATGQPVVSLSVFPLNAAGEAIEDNLGSSSTALAPDATQVLPLALLACGKVLVVAALADGQELRSKADLCQSNLVTLQP